MVYQFIRNNDRPDIYDLVDGQTVLSYVRLSEPKKDFLKKNGAKWVLESFKDNKKILFTGLVPTGNNVYSADHWNKAKGVISDLRITISNDLNKLSIEVLNTKKKGPHR
jgi:hypothetical protein